MFLVYLFLHMASCQNNDWRPDRQQPPLSIPTPGMTEIQVRFIYSYMIVYTTQTWKQHNKNKACGSLSEDRVGKSVCCSPKHSSSVCSADIQWITIACNSSTKDLTPSASGHTYTWATQNHTYIKMNFGNLVYPTLQFNIQGSMFGQLKLIPKKYLQIQILLHVIYVIVYIYSTSFHIHLIVQVLQYKIFICNVLNNFKLFNCFILLIRM